MNYASTQAAVDRRDDRLLKSIEQQAHEARVFRVRENMTEYTIKHRFTDEVLYTGSGETLRDVVVAAVKSGSDLSGSDLSGSNLRGSNLSYADLRGSDLHGSDLSDADLRGSDLSDADLRGSDLHGSDLSYADLRGSNLRGSNLRGSNLRGSNLSGSDLSGSDLSGSNLRSSNLSGSDLSGSDLSGSNLRGSNLSYADLRGSNLSGSDLSGSDLSGLNLRSSNLHGNKLVGSRPVLQIGPLGSRSDYLVAYLTDAGMMISAGCFFGTLDEFRAACDKTHGDSIHGREYAASIQMIEAHAALWTPAAEQQEAAA